MTSDERKMLEEIHEALFGVPPGSSEDEMSLIEGMRLMWTGYQRWSWVARSFVWVMLTLGALAGAYTAIVAAMSTRP